MPTLLPASAAANLEKATDNAHMNPFHSNSKLQLYVIKDTLLTSLQKITERKRGLPDL